MESIIIRWKETSERSLELADVCPTLLNSVMDYCKNNNIPLYNEESIWNLVNKVQSLSQEISNLNSCNFQKIADEVLQHKQNDKDLTEPK